MVFLLGPLPYDYKALEPYIDARSLEIHYTKHHQAYVDNLNKAVADYPELQKKSIEDLLKDLTQVPEAARLGVRNFGGGHYNHAFFWSIMGAKHDMKVPEDLAKAIEKQFGSFELFKEQFTKAAQTLFGSGWAWLVIDKKRNLQILKTVNQDCPLSDGLVPLLCIDVWEHAYYLQYQQKRADFIAGWWHVVNWEKVAENYRVSIT